MTKDYESVDKYEQKKRNEIMLGQAINNATQLLVASNPKLEGDFGEQYKGLIKLLYNYSQEAKAEIERGD